MNIDSLSSMSSSDLQAHFRTEQGAKDLHVITKNILSNEAWVQEHSSLALKVIQLMPEPLYKAPAMTKIFHAITLSGVFSSNKEAFKAVMQGLCTSGNIESVKKLFENAEFVHMVFDDGSTPAHIACKSQRFDIAEILKNKGANFEVRDKDGHTPLDLLVTGSNTDWKKVLKFINSVGVKIAPNESAGFFETIIKGPAPHNSVQDLLKVLSKHTLLAAHLCNKYYRAHPELYSFGNLEDAITSLLQFTMYNSGTKKYPLPDPDVVASRLIKEGAKVTTQITFKDDVYSTTVLEWAVSTRSEMLANQILDQKIDISEVQANLLERASSKGMTGLVKRLILEFNVSPSSSNFRAVVKGVTPFTLAMNNGYSTTAKMLIELGANDTMLNGEPILVGACKRGDKELVKALIEHGRNINEIHGPWYTAVTENIDFNPVNFPHRLEQGLMTLKKWAINEPGASPLFLAASQGWDDIVQLLIDRGADTGAKSAYSSILEQVLLHCKEDTALLLLQRQSKVDSKSDPKFELKGNVALLAAQKGYSRVLEKMLKHLPQLSESELATYGSADFMKGVAGVEASAGIASKKDWDVGFQVRSLYAALLDLADREDTIQDAQEVNNAIIAKLVEGKYPPALLLLLQEPLRKLLTTEHIMQIVDIVGLQTLPEALKQDLIAFFPEEAKQLVISQLSESNKNDILSKSVQTQDGTWTVEGLIRTITLQYGLTTEEDRGLLVGTQLQHIPPFYLAVAAQDDVLRPTLVHYINYLSLPQQEVLLPLLENEEGASILLDSWVNKKHKTLVGMATKGQKKEFVEKLVNSRSNFLASPNIKTWRREYPIIKNEIKLFHQNIRDGVPPEELREAFKRLTDFIGKFSLIIEGGLQMDIFKLQHLAEALQPEDMLIQNVIKNYQKAMRDLKDVQLELGGELTAIINPVKDVEPPREFIDPITEEVMKDPVYIEGDSTNSRFDRLTIERCNGIHPFDRSNIDPDKVKSDIKLKKQIYAFYKK